VTYIDHGLNSGSAEPVQKIRCATQITWTQNWTSSSH